MIDELSINNFRNLSFVTLKPQAKGLNIIFGENASGKTSLLEAIYFLGNIKSFRSKEIHHIIQHKMDSLVLFSRLSGENKTTLGIEKQRSGDSTLKINGEKAKSVAEIAESLPVQLITPHNLHMLDLGPQYKRAFLDWGVFHVKHEFIGHWKTFKRTLKQRNAALKAKASLDEINLWNQQLIIPSEAINQLRSEYLTDFNGYLVQICETLLPEFEFEVIYKAGWDTEMKLLDIWQDEFKKDCIFGYTQHGPHRANLVFKANQKPAEETLSRGQQKLFIYALKLAQGQMLKDICQKSCIYLIDDLGSELDNHNFNKIMQLLKSQQAQTFATMLEKPDFELQDTDISVFEMADGELSQLTEYAQAMSSRA